MCIYDYPLQKMKFDRVLQRSEQRFDRIKQKYDKSCIPEVLDTHVPVKGVLTRPRCKKIA